MINEKSIGAVDKSWFEKYFRLPLYDSYCFSNIPNTIQSLFEIKTGKTLPKDTLNVKKAPKKVVLLLIDGMGWNILEKNFKTNSYLKKLENNFLFSKLTAQFPATTAAEVTTLHLGEPVIKHGIYEWFIYEPKLDQIIKPVHFAFADKERESLRNSNLKPKDLFNGKTFYQKLLEKGVFSKAIFHKEYFGSAYSEALYKGAKQFGYGNLKEGLEIASSELKMKSSTKEYISFYYETLDCIGHNYGTDSKEYQQELKKVFKELYNFYESIKNLEDVMIIITADHGQKEIDTSKVQYVNEICPEILPMLRKNKIGQTLAPAGLPRDLFLHVEEKCLEEVKIILEKKIKDAKVFKTSDLIKLGIFGDLVPSKGFLKRVGNLVILPTGNNCVWWKDKNTLFFSSFSNQHGGMSREEMEIPFIVNYFSSSKNL